MRNTKSIAFSAATALLLTGCSIEFDALLRPFASDAAACNKLSEVIKSLGGNENAYDTALDRIAREVTPLAEPDLAKSLSLLTGSASDISGEGSIFDGLGAAVVATEQLGIILNRCIEVGVEVQYEE